MNKQLVIRIATRKSPLAMRQANIVAQQLSLLNNNIHTVMVPLVTTGDRLYKKPLYKIGGKSLFIKELEVALLEGKADIAVHSMKDLPTQLPPKLQITAICTRENPQDAFVSNVFSNINELNQNHKIGTSSLRRQSQFKAFNSNLNITFLRGNVGTRLKQLDDKKFDAIILATAGLIRLGYKNRITQYLPVDHFIPSAGQGAIGIESLASNNEINKWLKKLHHEPTAISVKAERELVSYLNGNCQTPIASYAYITEDRLNLCGMIGMPDGSTILKTNEIGQPNNYKQVAKKAAHNLIKQGAADILSSLKHK